MPALRPQHEISNHWWTHRLVLHALSEANLITPGFSQPLERNQRTAVGFLMHFSPLDAKALKWAKPSILPEHRSNAEC